MSRRLAHRIILERISKLGLFGWGGACGAAAIEMNRHVFDGKGTIVAGVNEYLLDAGRALGHVAVKYGGRYYDTDGEILEEDLLGWGIVDAEEEGFEPGTEELANEAILVAFDSDKEVLEVFPWCGTIPRRKVSE